MDIISTLLTCSLVSLVIFIWFRWKHSNLPPFPVPPLPLVGHLLYMDKNPRPQFKQWRKKCGDIFSLYLGTNLVVVLNGYELIKKVLVDLGTVTSDRPFIFFDSVTGKPGHGLAFSSGAVWKEHRAVTMNIMRSLGMGKNILVENITGVAAETMELLAKLKGEPTDLNTILTITNANIVLSIIIGQRFDPQDKEFMNFCTDVRANILEADGRNLANYIGFWEYLPGDLFGAKRIKKRTETLLKEFVEPYVQRKGYTEYDENNLDTYISKYVYEMNKKKKAGETTTLSNYDLIKTVYEFFGAGLDTSTTTLKWSVLYLVRHPEMQEKIYGEIEREIGLARPPNMGDKYKLNYLNAFIMEVQRISSIVPLNMFHQCSEDISIKGYTIPKGTTLIPSLDSILFDKKIWGEDVFVFRPERFLDENGKATNPDELVPFSMGKRMCAGESIARIQLFIFVSSMVQLFKFLPESPNSLPSLNVNFGITANPDPFKVRVIKRQI